MSEVEGRIQQKKRQGRGQIRKQIMVDTEAIKQTVVHAAVKAAKAMVLAIAERAGDKNSRLSWNIWCQETQNRTLFKTTGIQLKCEG